MKDIRTVVVWLEVWLFLLIFTYPLWVPLGVLILEKLGIRLL